MRVFSRITWILYNFVFLVLLLEVYRLLYEAVPIAAGPDPLPLLVRITLSIVMVGVGLTLLHTVFRMESWPRK